MITFDRQSFHHLFDQDSARLFEDMVFKRCYFGGCGLSITRSPALRSTVRNISVISCEQRGSLIYGAVFDTVIVDGLKTNGLLQTWAAVFKHVTLRGKIGRVMLSNTVAPGVHGFAPVEEQEAFDKANSEFYASVDWALDLTEAEFDECDLRGVPGGLIRRDRATQVLVTRKAAISGRWRNVDLSKTYWPTALEFFIESGAPEIVLVAPKRNRKFQILLEGLQKLRDSGVAEPN
jgi:hypothetical protein